MTPAFDHMDAIQAVKLGTYVRTIGEFRCSYIGGPMIPAGTLIRITHNILGVSGHADFGDRTRYVNISPNNFHLIEIVVDRPANDPA